MSELKLGWYKDTVGGKFVHLRFVAEDVINPSVMYQHEYQIFRDDMLTFVVCYEYVGTEKPENWVPADPSKITLEMLPMRARFRDHEEELWVYGSLRGFQKQSNRPFLKGSNSYFETCEVIQ